MPFECHKIEQILRKTIIEFQIFITGIHINKTVYNQRMQSQSGALYLMKFVWKHCIFTAVHSLKFNKKILFFVIIIPRTRDLLARVRYKCNAENPLNTWYNKKKISIKFCTQSEGRFLFEMIFVVAVAVIAIILCNEHRDFFLSLLLPNQIFIQLDYLNFTSCKQCNELNPNPGGGWNFKNVAAQLYIYTLGFNSNKWFFFLCRIYFFLYEILLNNQFSYFVNSSAFLFYLCVTQRSCL